MKKILMTMALVLSTTSMAVNTGDYVTSIANAAGLVEKQTMRCSISKSSAKEVSKEGYVGSYSYISKSGPYTTQYNIESAVSKYSKNAVWFEDDWDLDESLGLLFPYGAYGKNMIFVSIDKMSDDTNYSVCFDVVVSTVGKK